VLSRDRQLEEWIVAHRVGFLDPVARALSEVGTWGGVWLALALVLTLLRRRGDVFVWTLAAVVVASLTTDALKAMIGRDRPDVETLVAAPQTSSFPSGHASTGFACATVLGSFAPELRVPLYALATAIAWSRMYVGVHFPLDVIAGALWGIAVGLVLLRALPRLAAARRRSRRAPPAG
jgi:undecaprenyl-diphosphatase